MKPRLTRRLAALLVVATGVAGWGAACTDLPSDPQTPFSLAFRSPGSPGVVLGDTLRDSLGLIPTLRAVAYNLDGDSIPGAAITYHIVPVIDSTATGKHDSTPAFIDPTGRYVIARSQRVFLTRTFRVYAQVGGLQTQPVPFTVTRRPDTLIAGESLSLTLKFPDTVPTIALPARLRHNVDAGAGESAADSAVPAWLVRYQLVSPTRARTDTSYLMLTDGSRRSEVDTTDANGVASRSLRVRFAKFPFEKAPPAGSDTVYDSVYVRATAYAPGGAEVPRQTPRDILVIIKARKIVTQ